MGFSTCKFAQHFKKILQCFRLDLIKSANSNSNLSTNAAAASSTYTSPVSPPPAPQPPPQPPRHPMIASSPIIINNSRRGGNRPSRPKQLSLCINDGSSNLFKKPNSSQSDSADHQQSSTKLLSNSTTSAAANSTNISSMQEFSQHNRVIVLDHDDPLHKYDNIKVEDFQKIAYLGNGNYGVVEHMLHRPSNVEMAVKKLRRSVVMFSFDTVTATDTGDDSSQQQQSAAATNLNKHIVNDLIVLRKCATFPYIVQCYGYYIMETEVWIFMELMCTCFGRLLKKIAAKNGKNYYDDDDETSMLAMVPEDIIGKIASHTVSALNYLKVTHNVIHRDVKPANILINNDGVIKLCDFGIAGTLVDSCAYTKTVGCVAYMSPERIQAPSSLSTTGNTFCYDIRSDIWALGITLLEIATTRYPYHGFESDFELMSKILQENSPTLPVGGGGEKYSPECHSFIQACLTKDYSQRPKYQQLMEMEFLRNYEHKPVNVAQWLQNVLAPN